MTALDADGQPRVTAFNFKRNREKAAFALHGILKGIVADEQLGSRELLFLDAWLRSQRRLDDGDVVDLLDLIGSVLRDGVITTDELNEVRDLVTDIIQFRNAGESDVEASINELLGLLHGVVADGKVTESEFQSLIRWLEQNQQATYHWPANEIVDRIGEILGDERIDEDELGDLHETLKRMCGHDFDDSGLAHGGAAEIFSSDVSAFNPEGQTLCFTGKFICGTRKAVESEAKLRGAFVSRNVTQKTGALVIGTLASRDWRFSSHGRKVEQALLMQRNNFPILIFSERQWRGVR